MDDLEAPSFSLGFDLDFDPESEPHFQNPDPVPVSSTASARVRTIEVSGKQTERVGEGEKEKELWGEVMDSDPEPGSDLPRILKRLRRGGGPGKKRGSEALVYGNNAADCDDDIEEFCSQEDFISKDGCPSKQLHTVCSSSKVPLSGCGVLSNQPSSQWKTRKREQDSHASDSASAGASCHLSIFPKLTISPLRKFQLIESDSDDPSGDENLGKKVLENRQQSAPSEQRSTPSMERTQNEDLWKDFCPMKSFSIPTPALDEFCEEYYRNVNDKNEGKAGGGVCINENKGCRQNKISGQKFEQCWGLADPLPPAHHYFFHDDPRIQKLVRSCLPNFFPLGVVSRGNEQPSAPDIDYMGQFNTGEASKQEGTQKTTRKKSSTRGRNKLKRSNVEEVLHASEGWVNPRSSAPVPKDAGRKRVHGNSQSAGHWYTSPEGRKVYVSRSGQELTGQIAYRHYRKESGRAFNKSKKENKREEEKRLRFDSKATHNSANSSLVIYKFSVLTIFICRHVRS